MNKLLQCKTAVERVADISERCGLPQELVQLVLQCQSECALDDLKEGKRVVLTGLCTLTPTLKKNLGRLNNSDKSVVIECNPSPILSDNLNTIDKFELQIDSPPNGCDFNTAYLETLNH